MLIEVAEGNFSSQLLDSRLPLSLCYQLCLQRGTASCPNICTSVKPECNIRENQSAYKRGKKKVLKALLVIAVGFLPSLISLWVIRKIHLRSRLRLRQAAMNFPPVQGRQNLRPVESDRYYLEGVGYLIGDISCKFNARSGYIRCAVNPEGPCNGCRHYEPKGLAGSEKIV
jgi:hypothetical protein